MAIVAAPGTLSPSSALLVLRPSWGSAFPVPGWGSALPFSRKRSLFTRQATIVRALAAGHQSLLASMSLTNPSPARASGRQAPGRPQAVAQGPE